MIKAHWKPALLLFLISMIIVIAITPNILFGKSTRQSTTNSSQIGTNAPDIGTNVPRSGAASEGQDMLDLFWWLRNGGGKMPILDNFFGALAIALFGWCPINWRTWTGPYWP
jgi:hypothetical protein